MKCTKLNESRFLLWSWLWSYLRILSLWPNLLRTSWAYHRLLGSTRLSSCCNWSLSCCHLRSLGLCLRLRLRLCCRSLWCSRRHILSLTCSSSLLLISIVIDSFKILVEGLCEITVHLCHSFSNNTTKYSWITAKNGIRWDDSIFRQNSVIKDDGVVKYLAALTNNTVFTDFCVWIYFLCLYDRVLVDNHVIPNGHRLISYSLTFFLERWSQNNTIFTGDIESKCHFC